MPKAKHVYIVNRGLHDYTQAPDFGDEVIALTEGSFSRVNVTNMVRTILPILQDSDSGDWLMLSGPPTINCVACVLFALKHKCLNLLIYASRDGGYIPRNLVLEDVGL